MAANPHNPAESSVKQQNKTTAHRRTHSGGGISNAISNLCKNFSFNNCESENVHNGGSITTTIIRKSKSNTTLDNDFETTSATSSKSNCDCTNISIMHLFHEMKQEFPTIPDEIVNKHVNEHCHQKDVCLKLLQDELALHPSPVQTYPSKVLQQLPKKPLKPARKAPLPQLITAPTITSAAINQTAINGISYSVLKKQQEEADEKSHDDQPRTRPTTLDLFAAPQQQQQQYQMVQVQLKQHIQQRNQQVVNKPVPVRRAPLPPVPPKPTHLRTPTTSTESDGSVISPTTALAKSLPHNKSYTSLSASCMNSNNVSKTNGSKSADQSPIRHRAVLNMQPQVPSVRAFVNTSPTTPTSPVNLNGQKSFTSVNLTLRKPAGADASTPTTIDIVAGPGVSGAGGNGLTYSSTSYNAQQGYQKTFNITVSDEGSEISATRIRSPNAAPTCMLEDRTHTPNSPNRRQRLSAANTYNSEEENKDTTAKLELQKARRDKLATVLRDNKKKLLQMEQKINMLTENISPEVTARLDDEINKLRADCECLLNDIEVVRRNANENNHISTTSRAFPSHRAWLPRSMPALLPNDSCGTPTTSTSSASTPGHYHEPNSERFNDIHHNTPLQQPQHHLLPPYNEYNDLSSGDDVETDDEDEVNGQLDMWACNMCTFRNHPQLNICECCENVRIQPGTIRIVNGAAATAPSLPTNNNNNNNSNAANLENNSNLTQLALHT